MGTPSLTVLRTFTRSLLNGSDDVMQSRLRKVLELLGVKSLYPIIS